ncbi:MAG: translation elongation factor Ts [Chloroflexi bacterium]|nr:MAG: translation elongation factor Ts [Chloroflexota bacterium]
MAFSSEDVKRLRDLTGAGMLDCKNAIEEADGDFDKAKDVLRQRGFEAAAKRSERETAEGVIHSYIHHNRRIGALVEINCESDFVARTDDFQNLAKQIGLQVAAANPLYISADELPEGAEGDPKELCLLEQPFVQDESRTIQDLLTEVIGKMGENIRIRRFARFELGRYGEGAIP